MALEFSGWVVAIPALMVPWGGWEKMANHSKRDKGKCVQKSFFSPIICSSTEIQECSILRKDGHIQM